MFGWALLGDWKIGLQWMSLETTYWWFSCVIIIKSLDYIRAIPSSLCRLSFLQASTFFENAGLHRTVDYRTKVALPLTSSNRKQSLIIGPTILICIMVQCRPLIASSPVVLHSVLEGNVFHWHHSLVAADLFVLQHWPIWLFRVLSQCNSEALQCMLIKAINIVLSKYFTKALSTWLSYWSKEVRFKTLINNQLLVLEQTSTQYYCDLSFLKFLCLY